MGSTVFRKMLQCQTETKQFNSSEKLSCEYKDGTILIGAPCQEVYLQCVIVLNDILRQVHSVFVVSEIKTTEWRQHDKCMANCNKQKLEVLFTVAIRINGCMEHVATTWNKRMDCTFKCNVHILHCLWATGLPPIASHWLQNLQHH
jgi:hypothetical protein